MPLFIVGGLSEMGDGSHSALISCEGFGDPESSSSGCEAFVVLEALATALTVTAILNSDLTISGPAANPANYIITPVSPGAYPVTVTAVNVSTNNIVLTTTEMTDGATYSLTFPELGILSTLLEAFDGPFTVEFVGYGVPPGVSISKSVDARTLDIVFTEAVNTEDALNPDNYSISPTVTVKSVQKITDLHYRLTTTKQDIDQSYNATISNIRDLAGNVS